LNYSGTKSCPEVLHCASLKWQEVKHNQEEFSRLQAAADALNMARENIILTPVQMKSKLLLLMKEMQEMVCTEVIASE